MPDSSEYRRSDVTFGISIPLWENRGRIRHADAARVASERVAEDASDALAARCSQRTWRQCGCWKKTASGWKKQL